MKWTWLGLVAAPVVVVGCKRHAPEANPTLAPAPILPRVDGRPDPPPAVGPPKARAAEMRTQLRVPPDRRFLLAIEHIDRVFDGASSRQVTAKRRPTGFRSNGRRTATAVSPSSRTYPTSPTSSLSSR